MTELAVMTHPEQSQPDMSEEMARLCARVAELERERRRLEVSESGFRMLMDSAVVGVYRSTLDGRLLYLNEYGQRLIDKPPDRSLGDISTVTGYRHPEDREKIVRALRECGVVEGVEVEALTLSGRPIWVLMHARLVGDEIVGTFADVTERKQAENARQASEGACRDLVEHLNDVIFTVDEKGLVSHVTLVVEQMLGYAPADLVGRCYRDLIHPEDVGMLDAAFADVLVGRLYPSEFRVRTKSGDYRWVRTSSQPMVKDGRTCGLCGMMIDISAQKAAEERLREKEERLRLLSDLSFEGVALLGDELVLDVNGTFARMFEYEVAELIGMPMRDLVAPSSHKVVVERLSFLDEEHFEAIGRRKDGSEFAVEMASKQTIHRGKHCRCVSIRDVTVRKRLERHLLMVASRERMRMRMQLHDGVCQQLSGIGMVAKALSSDLAMKSRVETATAESIVKMLGVVIDQARSLARDLQPIAQDSGALFIALDDLVRRTGKISKSECRYSANSKITLQDHDAASQLYLIAQEALSNAVRHAEAGHIDVSVRRAGDALVLRVEDDGRGIPAVRPPVVAENGSEASVRMGLDIMRYRAGLIGAAMRIGPRAGGGTVVECEWKGK